MEWMVAALFAFAGAVIAGFGATVALRVYTIARATFLVGRIPRSDVFALALIVIVIPLATFSLAFTGVDPVAVALLVLAIVAGLAVGWGIGQLEFRLTPNILEALVDVQLDPVDWSAPDAVKATMAFLERAPPYLRSVVESIVLVFNSPWISIALGTGPRTFVHKSHADRKAYLDKWVADANLRYGLELLKVVLAIGVYDDPGIWKKIGYCGPVVLPNSPGGPDVFCAYDREDAASRGMVGDARFACRGDP